MLRHLSIRNYTLIASLELELEGGLTVITGETGTGKSIVLDALGLALGNRADSRALRPGADRLEVSAGFDLGTTPAASAWLGERELDQDGECHLRRVMTRDGRSRAWINGQTVTLQDLKSLGDLLVDMHGQHEHHSLLQRATHQRLLDDYGGHLSLAAQVGEAHARWRACREEMESLRASSVERRDRQQLLNYQLGELAELAVRPGEIEQLERDQQRLASSGELCTQIESVLALCEDGDEGGLLQALRRACSSASGLGILGDRGANARQLLDSAYIQLDEARREMHALRDGIDLNPALLAEVDNRMSAIYQMARKHRVPASELPQLQLALGEEAASLQVSDERIDMLGATLQQLEAHWAQLAARLSAARAATASDISSRVQDQLAYLGMESCRFAVATHALEQVPNARGAEQIEFLISTNPGAAPDSLARIASGGELSRISLAIQVIIASGATTPTVIFDEVDVGIGGATADAVGSLLQSLGQRVQVLCVTHLPQVAARGATHLRASKLSSSEETTAQLQALDQDERVAELARMLGGKKITSKTQEHAREMLEAATSVA